MWKARLYSDAVALPDQSLFAEALSSVDTSIWQWDLEVDHFLVSDVFYQKTAIAPNSLQHATAFLDLFSESDRNRLLQSIQNKMSSGDEFSCCLNLPLDRISFQLEIKGRCRAQGGGQKSVLGTIRMVEQIANVASCVEFAHMDGQFARLLESSVALERNFYQSVLDHSQTAIAVKNMDGKYLLVSKAFIANFAPAVENIESKNHFDIFNAELAQRFQKLDHAVMSRLTATENKDEAKNVVQQPLSQNQLSQNQYEPQCSLVFEFDQRSYCSVHFPISQGNGKVLAVGQIITDVSRRKFVMEQSEQHRKELGLLLDSVSAPIFYFDRSGQIKHGNRHAGELAPLNNVKGKCFPQALPFWDKPEQRQQEIMQVIEFATPIYDSREVALIEGGRRFYKVDKVPTYDTEGSVTGVLLVMNDVTKETTREMALRESEARYRAFIETTTDLIWCFELQPGISIRLSREDQIREIETRATLVECNLAFALVNGADSTQELLGKPLSRIDGVDKGAVVQAFVEHQYRLIDFESKHQNLNGETLWWQITAMGNVERGCLQRVWGTAKNITDQKKHLQDMEYQATHDSLTGLPNRVALYQEIEKAIDVHKKTSGQTKKLMALLLIDLDRFKEINDTLGHQVGDKLLKKIGPRLQEEMQDLSGTVARLGGDEFAILLSSIRNPQQAVVFGHRVLDSISQAFYLEGLHTEISASIGIALLPNQAEDLSTLMRYADVAMYRAKKDTLGVALYLPEEDPHSTKRLALMSELRRSIREDHLTLHFQPKIDFTNNELHGFEALVRWHHPEMGFITPGEFIPIAENTGLIHPMTAWVLENSVKQLRKWHLQGFDTKVSVNLSARNLLDEGLVENIKELLQRYQIPTYWLELEITESAIMIDPKRALNALNEINKLGVRLSIDDFGTGYSSLSYLKKLPVQLLKIDYSFVIDMLEDEQDRIIVNSTINLAHNLGLKVVAEGVETNDVANALRLMNCDYAQGYYFSRPVPAHDAYEFAQQWCGTNRPC